MNARILLVALAMPCLAACAVNRERVPGIAHPTANMTGVPLPVGETYTGGEPLSQVMPVYPPAQRTACHASEEVDVAVYVDENGKVQDVIGIVVDMALPPWNTFFAAVRPAAMQWRFEPLRVDHWAADADGNTHDVDGKALTGAHVR